MTRRGCGGSALCALREEGYGMAQGMNKLNEALASLPEVRELLLSLDAGTSPIAVSGLSGVHRAQLAAAVRHKTQRPLLIVCADENEANRMAGDLHELLGEDVSLLFAREWQLRDRVFASHGWEQQRIGSLCSLAAGKAPILVATVDGLMQRTLPPDTLRGAVTDISLGDRFDLNALSKKTCRKRLHARGNGRGRRPVRAARRHSRRLVDAERARARRVFSTMRSTRWANST